MTSAKNCKMYENKVILAPMVRIGTLPTRVLSLRYGADLVYTEELIDFKLLKCIRRQNEALNTIDYVETTDGSLVLRICPEEQSRLIVQMGTACAERALKVAKMLENDVAGIDINMGCPKEFSVKGGMGVALFYNLENAKKILKTLVENCKIPITCKIRVKPDKDETIAAAKQLEATGISAIGVHGRTRDERPRHPCNRDFIKCVAEALEIPVIANGGSAEIKNYEDLMAFRAATGASSVMIARSAQWNCSVFRKEGPLPIDDVIREYLKLAIQYDNPVGNTKFNIQNILRDVQETEMGQKFLAAQSIEEMCEIWGLLDFYKDAQSKKTHLDSAIRRECIVDQPNKKQKLDSSNDENIITHKIRYLKSKYKENESPKQTLNQHSTKLKMPLPKYEIINQGKLFQAVVTFENEKFSSTYFEVSKRFAEQSAALVCLYSKGFVTEEQLIKDGILLS
ncbi:tRNA-dihydrouridine(20) synthase [NAD(P)+]-like [Culicoides brevitarsis]|uniref:tRNA-dihydrouridine(20) synthase [NAD(P)+]-like n=1 Tax=Culicoides brevitarsis TaxID=469753 RepID=UPI00307BC06C